MEDYEIHMTSGSDPDTLYYNESMQADNSADFKAAMLKEGNNHMSSKHCIAWEKQNVSNNQDMHPAVWAFKHKVDKQAIYMFKAQLNLLWSTGSQFICV
jgi:hypothetical protein